MILNNKLFFQKSIKFIQRPIYSLLKNSISNISNDDAITKSSAIPGPKFEPLKIQPKIQKSSHIFYQKPKKFYNLSTDMDFEKFKCEMMNCSIIEQLDFYEQNKNQMTDLFYDSFLIIFSQKIEIGSYEYIHSVCNRSKKFTMIEIVETLRKSSFEIKSKSNLIANIYLFYVIGLKELKFFDRLETENFLKTFTKYVSDNIRNFTFSEKLQISTCIAQFQNINFENYLSEDFNEIEKIGYFELTKIMHRISKFKSSYQNKLNLINLILYPYIRMSLENSLNNQVNAFFLLNLYSSELIGINLQNETEDFLNLIKEGFSELKSTKNLKELLQFKWVELFKGLSVYKGAIDSVFLNSLYDVLFNEILLNLNKIKQDQSDEDTGINLYKFIVIIYRISLLNIENLPNENLLGKFYNFINSNSRDIENLFANIPQQHMLGIFLIMKKSNYIDVNAVRLFTKLLINKVHLFDISENSVAFKEIVKEKLNGEELNYEIISSSIIHNTYTFAIKKECRLLPLLKATGVTCFFAEKTGKQLDSIFYILIDKMNENKDLINIYPNFLHYYVENHQKNLLPEYRAKIIKKFLQIFTKDKISQITYGSAIIKCYMYLNQLLLPESDYDELKTQLLQLIAHIQKLIQFKSNFGFQLKAYALNKFSISNSSIVAVVITMKSLYKELLRSDELHLFQNNMISFVYLAVKNDSKNALNREALNSLLEAVDEITLITSKTYKNKRGDYCFNFNESSEIFLTFLENGLNSEVLKTCYLKNEKDFKQTNDSYKDLTPLFKDDNEMNRSNQSVKKLYNLINQI